MKQNTSTYEKIAKGRKDVFNDSTENTTLKDKEDNRVDPTEKRDLTRLVDYYRLLLNTFEKERLDYYNRLDNLKITNDEEHKLDWEYKRRKDEIIELEQALYQASISLGNERKKAIHYSNQIENCRIRKKEDHRRIIQLLQLAEPIEQTIKLYEGKKPVKTEKYSNFNLESGIEEIKENLNNVSLKRASLAKNKCKRECSCNKPKINKGPKSAYRIAPSDEKQQILRTIMLPNEQKTVEVNMENEALKNEIENIKNDFDEKIEKLEENRKIREEEFRQKCLQYNKESEDLLKECQKLEKLNHEITKDIMELKYDNGLSEKKVYEEMEVTRLNNRNLENHLKDVVLKSKQEKQHSLNEYNKKTREITACLRGQVRSQEENANIIKEQYEQIQKIYTSKVKNLTQQLKDIAERCKLIEERKNFSVEGYINEIKLMRKRLKTYQDYVRKVMLQVDKNKETESNAEMSGNNIQEQEYSENEPQNEAIYEQ